MSKKLEVGQVWYSRSGGRQRAVEAKPSADSLQVGGRHYQDMPIQPWAVMESVLTPEEFRGFLKGNIIRYTMRAGRKEGTDDAGKARHYMQKLAEVEAHRGV